MAAAGFRHSGKSRAKSSTQGWSPNSGQVAEDASRNPALVLASGHEQQSSASNLTLPQQEDQQAGTQTQSASSVDQMDRATTTLLGTTRRRLLRMPRVSTSLLGTIRHHSQATILTLPASLKLNRLTLSAETMPRRDRTLPSIETLRCQTHQQCTTLLHQDA